MAEKIITGIDIGTYHVKVAVAKLPNQPNGGVLKPEIIGTGMAESRGLKNGYIIHPEDVARSVKAAVAQAEKTAGQPIKRAHVAIGSIGLEEIYSHGEIIPARADSEVTSSDLEKLLEDSEERVMDRILIDGSYMAFRYAILLMELKFLVALKDSKEQSLKLIVYLSPPTNSMLMT